MIHAKLYTAILLVISFFIMIGTSAQDFELLDKRSQKAFSEAQDFYYAGDMQSAEIELKKVLDKYPRFAEALLLMADIHMELGNTTEAIPYYYRALRTDSELPPALFLVIGRAEMELMRYDSAIDNFNRFLDAEGIGLDAMTYATSLLELTRFRKKLVEDPVLINLKNLGDAVNSGSDEYVNAMTADQKEIFFTRKIKILDRQAGQRQFDEDFWHSEKLNGEWSVAELLGSPVDSRGDAGAMSISPDGKAMYFTACFRDDSYGSCDIFRSQSSSRGWTIPENLGTGINSGAWDSQPCISPDGKRLYFTSSRRGGKGKSDIYYSERNESGDWGPARSIGEVINTPGTEMAPFIHFDNRTMYFSSDGHPGMGGMDLFVSRFNDSTGWSSPVNLGYPLNTASDEITMIVNAAGTSGFISADVPGGYGNKDIYKFTIPEEKRPEPVTYVQGRVYDAATGEPLGAHFILIGLQHADTTMDAYSDPANGEFLVCLPTDRNYALHVSRKGYMFYSLNFDLQGLYSATEPYQLEIPLKPIVEGSVQILRNIFYDTDKYELKPESLPELNKLVEFLYENPEIKLEISGHTDNVGTAEYNQALSERRAGKVHEFLLNKGIDISRISFKGYGLNKPVAENETPEGRAENRRTEIRITGVR